MPDQPSLLSNAAVILPDRVHRGWVALRDGAIAELGEGRPPERGLDLEGDFLLPGLVELHTDHLESHHTPRPGVRWHALAAVLAYDAQIAASGITTVFDSLRAGSDSDGGGAGAELLRLAEALAQAREAGLFRCEHRLHLRCEVPAPDVVPVLRGFAARFPVHLLSLMDHTPGQRQFRDLDKYHAYYTRRSGRPPAEIGALAARKIAEGSAWSATNRPALLDFARNSGVALASHDDTTLDDVAQSVAEGVALAEFPTTAEAAAACRDAGIQVMMGAPNLIRGGSHSGNVAAADLAPEGMLDILSSDYVPGSLLLAAFGLPEQVPGMTLPQAVATVTRAPARAAGLHDRGEIAPGRRADLVRVRLAGDMPVVRQVWRGGARVF
ncbi:alpha-D-ribose 1-methylphosphonate 5-triphosphate diphosphatase [Roseomonas sp. BN140053]|uniref:alpha-D-ribose 1-methylphosphonate 5-triphosphate diphosphatase n=1 Tax=Roseomonas sp. BN140053 TaxID=3391898 RepID=UPI0039E8A1B4